MMRFALRFTGTTALAVAPLTISGAQVAGKDLALDFRMSTSTTGRSDSGAVSGQIISSGTKVRIDLKTGGGPSPTPLPSDGPVTMIVTDSGRTITYLDVKNNQYIRFRPAEMMAQAQEMGGMMMKFSGTTANVVKLGAGPAILGHPTSHYRVEMGMTMTISAMGQEQSATIASTTEYYFPTDIKSDINPFASMTGTDMVTMFGSGNKEFATKMKAAQDKLPKAPPLRTVATATVTAQGLSQVTTSRTDVTSLKWVKADPRVFEIPAGYTSVEMPGMEGPPPGK